MNPDHPPSHPDWNAVIAQAKQGDDAAACWLVESLHGHILRIVRNHLPRHADEQDLVQEVFMKMFSRIESFRSDRPFPNWVARIALNTCYDHLRRQKSRPELRFSDLGNEDIEFIESLIESSSATSSSPVNRDGQSLVNSLLATLNPREQMVLRLMDLEKKSVREISDLTGWGSSKIKVTAMRGRRKLNTQLKLLGGYPS